jgi:hypothetical protein
MAEFLPERKDTEGFLKAPEGDAKGTGLFGLAEEAVQADFQEFQFFQELGDLGLFGAALLDQQLVAEMFGMATEGRNTEAMGSSQGAVRHAIDKGAIDLRAGGVITDGAAGRLMGGAEMFRHKFYSSRSMVPHRRDTGAT